MSNLILGYGLLGKEIHRQTGWDYTKVLETKEMQKYKTIINCIGYTRGEDMDSNYVSNAKIPYELVGFCNSKSIKLVHISTDYIYAGSQERANEIDVPITNNSIYTYSKLIADILVSELSWKSLILRGTHKKKPFTYTGAWADQVGNFDYVDVIADLYIQLINKGATGIYNVGTETKTMYDLAKQTKADVVPIRGGNYPKNVTMNLDKMKNFLK